MVINTNNAAQRAANNLNDSQDALGNSLSRLSSGNRIVNPSDDAAGLAVSSRLAAQISLLQAARDNVANATSFTQTQDGYLKSVDAALMRMGELAMLAKDPTKSPSDRSLYDAEFQQLKSFIRETVTREQNGTALFDGGQWTVTQDADGNTFNITKPDLNANVYTDAIEGQSTWETTIDLWKVTQDGFVINVDMWKDSGSKWHTLDPGGGATKFDNGSFVKDVPNLDNPLMNLRFAGNANDTTGNGHDGTVIGATPTTNSSGTPNSAYYFDGAGDKITFADTGLPTGNADRTMAAYFRLDNTTGSPDKTIIRYGNIGHGNQSMGLVLRNGELMPTAWGASNEYVIPGNLADGNWHHVAWSLHSGTAKTYIDGTLVDTRSFSPNTVLGSGIIGYNTNPAGEDWLGSIDDINIFDRALTATEINSMMNNDFIDNSSFNNAITTDGLVNVDPTASGNNEDPGATKIPSNSVVTDDPTTANPGATSLTTATHLKDLASAGTAMGLVQTAAQQAALDRAGLGASQARMQAVDMQLTEVKHNLTLARSRITDVDVAEEATEFARRQILVQSGTQMLAEANSLPKMALQLLQGLSR